MTRHPRTLTCWICKMPFQSTAKGGRRICGTEGCALVREVVYRLLRTRREQVKREGICPYCGAAAIPGSKFCPQHIWIREPCLRCHVGRRRRNEGRGEHPRFCDPCRGRETAALDPADDRT